MRFIVDKCEVSDYSINGELKCISLAERGIGMPRSQYLFTSAQREGELSISPMRQQRTINLNLWPRGAEMQITQVIYSDPATIVYWKDGTKTVVKCQEGDTYDKEKGLALCFMKKMLGNKSGDFNRTLKEWLF